MSYWYDKDGKVIAHLGLDDDRSKWLDDMTKVEKLLSDRNYKIVKQEHTLLKDYWVSTVWLGLDHSFNGPIDAPNPHPLIFETMVFDENNDRDSVDMERYETQTQALAGHRKMLRKWSRKERAKHAKS